MNSLSDPELLSEYVARHSEHAFAELVKRRFDFVFNAALRIVQDAAFAEDVTQSVFIALSANARPLIGRTSIIPWLHRVTVNIASKLVRTEVRRRKREEELGKTENSGEDSTHEWAQISPWLDSAIDTLDEKSREALLMRFLEEKSFKTISAILHITEEAAQKRVSRALTKLRERLLKVGIPIGETALSSAFLAKTTSCAPIGMINSITRAAFVWKGASNFWGAGLLSMKMKLALLASLSALLIPLFYQRLKLVEMREQHDHAIAALRKLQTLSPVAGRATAKTLSPESREERLELLRLRGKVTELNLRLRDVGAEKSRVENVLENQQEPAAESDSPLWTASLTNRVASGETLAIGGWSRGMDTRGFLLLTPTRRKTESMEDEINVASQIVEAPSSFWSQIGWGELKTQKNRSTIAILLNAEQRDLLLAALNQVKGSELSNVSNAERKNGEEIGLGFAVDDGIETGSVMMMTVHPKISEHDNFVDLEFSPTGPAKNLRVHSSVSPAVNETSANN